MKINRKLLPFIIPVTAGIIVGSAVLLIKPSTGKKIGDLINQSRLKATLML